MGNFSEQVRGDSRERHHAELDDATYPTGIKISDAQIAALPIARHDFHGDWNYTLTPTEPS